MKLHPAPWKWDGYASKNSDDCGESLLDANGKLVLTADCDGEPGPRASAIIALAPEMEALLRHWASAIDRDSYDLAGPTRALLASIPPEET